jgi:hypothetical protein
MDAHMIRKVCGLGLVHISVYLWSHHQISNRTIFILYSCAAQIIEATVPINFESMGNGVMSPKDVNYQDNQCSGKEGE